MGLIPKLKSKKPFPRVPVGAHWQTRLWASPASPGIYAGCGGGGSPHRSRAVGRSRAPGQSRAAAAIPSRSRERAGSQRFTRPPHLHGVPRGGREGRGATGPGSDAAASPQPSGSPAQNLGFNSSRAGRRGRAGESRAQASSFVFFFLFLYLV